MGLVLTSATLSSLVEDIYDCSLNTARWNATLTRIRDTLDCAYVAVTMSNPALVGSRFVATSPWDIERLLELTRDYQGPDIPGAMDVVMGDIDTPRSTMQDCPEPTFQQTRFYRNWVGPQHLRDASLVKFVQTPDRIGLLTATTHARRDLVTAEEREFLRLLAPHIRRASMIGDLLDYQRVETELFRSAFDRLAVAVVLVDDECCIKYANGRADALLAEERHIRSAAGRLVTGNRLAATALADAVRRKTGLELGRRGIGIPVGHQHGEAAVAYVLPLATPLLRSAFQPAAAAVFITTATAPLQPDAVIATLYDLTPSEARVFLLVGQGATLQTIGTSLEITENTVKTHLARVFQKVGVNRQQDLVALVAALRSPVDLATGGEDHAPLT